jgi:hypothetical protein
LATFQPAPSHLHPSTGRQRPHEPLVEAVEHVVDGFGEAQRRHSRFGLTLSDRVVVFCGVAFTKRKVTAPVPPTPEALYPALPHGPAAPREL